MASSSAAERSATTPELRAYRGRQVCCPAPHCLPAAPALLPDNCAALLQVILVFSNQGMGNFANTIAILIASAWPAPTLLAHSTSL